MRPVASHAEACRIISILMIGRGISCFLPWCFSAWSPDGTRFLYGAEQPCILEWEKEHSWCLEDGRSFHRGEQVIDYDWSPDGSAVSYIYFSDPIGSTTDGGICIKSLIGGDIRCPTMDIPELTGRYVRRYRWSPDGQYLIFVSDSDSCPDCDYATDPQIGIIDVNKGTYWYPLEDFDYDTPDLALWRPAIGSQ
jgi:WD40 repeat protein